MKKLIITLLFSVMLFSCKENITLNEVSTEAINNKRYVEDFESTIETLEANYPFINVLKRNHIDFYKLKDQYLKEIQSTQLDDNAFYDIMDSFIDALDYTGHIDIINNKSYQHYVNTNMTPWYETAHLPATEEFYSASKTKKKLSINDLFTKPDPITYEFYDDINTVYINFPSFQYERIEDDKKVLDDIYSQLNNYDHLILDIRKNAGGASSYYKYNIVTPLIQNDLSFNTYMFYNETSLNKPFFDYKTDFDFIHDVPKESIDLSQFKDIVYDDLEPLNRCIYMNHQLTPEGEGFNGDIYLLVSDYVYSSAEGFAILCKETEFATIVGEQTGGDGIGFDPIIYSMPHTGILVKFSSHYGINSDGSNSEEHGTTPDMIVETDALTYLKEYLKSQD